nr:MAG TPA: hypothetical protein [Caudoviricetes sp.]
MFWLLFELRTLLKYLCCFAFICPFLVQILIFITKYLALSNKVYTFAVLQ